MVTLTLPPRGAHPEHWTAIKQLIAAGVEVDRVVRVIGAGDPGAQRNVEGRPMPTVLFVGGGRPLTAVVGRGTDVVAFTGWGS